MAKKVGIPRGLFYYQFYPLWKTFFEELGAELIVSDYTTKKILDDGVKACVDEACLPVKLYHGHVINLKDRVDYLFIPRFTSISRNEYICPKFGGLPDMIRNNFENLPEIIDTEINLRKSKRNALRSALKIGRFFCTDSIKIRRVYKNAVKAYRQFRKQIKSGKLPSDILNTWDSEKFMDGSAKLQGLPTEAHFLTIAVIGHAYNLYDAYINMNMLNKFKANGVKIITIDMIDSKIINKLSRTLPKRMFWNYGRRALGSALHIIERGDVDGMICVMSFGCGVDSFVCDMIERRIKRNSDIPFITLTIDEHSGEAGMDTRIEAFIDMIRWRGRNENHIPAFG